MKRVKKCAVLEKRSNLIQGQAYPKAASTFWTLAIGNWQM